MEEIWKDVIGYEGHYKVSNLGNVKSIFRMAKHYKGGEKLIHEKQLKVGINKGGYFHVGLYKDGKSKTKKVHQLVAETFLRKPKNKNIVNHIDGVKNNNNVSNLEWTDHRGNMKHYGEKLEKGYRVKRVKVKQDLEKAKQTILNLAYDLYSKTQTPDEFVKLYGATYNL